MKKAMMKKARAYEEFCLFLAEGELTDFFESNPSPLSGVCDDDRERTAPFIDFLPEESGKSGGSPLRF